MLIVELEPLGVVVEKRVKRYEYDVALEGSLHSQDEEQRLFKLEVDIPYQQNVGHLPFCLPSSSLSSFCKYGSINLF